MKKVCKVLSIILLAISLGDILYRLIESIVYQVNGWHLTIPGPALFKWYEIFCFNMLGDIMTFSGATFIIGVILMIIGLKKKKW